MVIDVHRHAFEYPRLYQSLMRVQASGVWGKLLFGSDSPFTAVTASIDGLRGLNRMVEGTSLPRLDAAEIEGLIHRDSLEPITPL